MILSTENLIRLIVGIRFFAAGRTSSCSSSGIASTFTSIGGAIIMIVVVNVVIIDITIVSLQKVMSKNMGCEDDHYYLPSKLNQHKE
jgi:hypothetical protein